VPSEQTRQKPAPLMQVVKAVLWSFLGIRRRAEHESDALQLKPAQVIVAGLVGAAVFVLSLVLLVRFIVSRAA
jgi:preprotein translocase subunit Sec61beta